MVKPFTCLRRTLPPILLASAGVRAGLVLTDPLRNPDPFALSAVRHRGLGMIERSYELPLPERGVVAHALARSAKTAGMNLLVSGDPYLARRTRSSLHAREKDMYGQRRLQFFGAASGAVHSRRAIDRALALNIRALLVSPVFPTRSHRDARVLTIHRFARLIRGLNVPVFALGGVNPRTARRLRGIPSFYGIAAIDGWCLGGFNKGVFDEEKD